MRVLFSSTGGDGHLLPLLPLAQAFARRGADVLVAPAPGQRRRVEAVGLRHEGVGPDPAELDAQLRPHRAHLATLPIAERRGVAFSTRFGVIEAPVKLAPLRALVERFAPGLVVHEAADLAAPIAAGEAGVPAVHHSFGRAIPEHALRAAAEKVAHLWESAGLSPDPLAGAFLGPYVDICPPSLDLPLAEAPPQVHRLRPAEAPPRERADRDRPLVYVTLGTVWNELSSFRVILDAVATLDCDAVLTIGANRDPKALDPVPRNATVVQYIPQAEILPLCDVVVAHGGSGSFLAALAHGRPLVLLPHGADQFENAAACAEIGAAEVVLPEDLSVERVRGALERVLEDGSYAAAAARVAAEIAAMPTADEVAARLEAWPPISVG